jgi:sulfur carrier protein
LNVNGESLTLSEAVTLTEFLVKAGYVIAQIAVEMNGKIIPKGEYETVLLHDADALEIFTFMGGG